MRFLAKMAVCAAAIIGPMWLCGAVCALVGVGL